MTAEVIATLVAELARHEQAACALRNIIAIYKPNGAPPQAVAPAAPRKASNKRAAPPKSDSLRQRILAAMEPGEELSALQLAARMNEESKPIGVALSQLNEAGDVDRVDRGVYRKP